MSVTDRQRDQPTDRQTDRQIDRETERQKERETEREKVPSLSSTLHTQPFCSGGFWDGGAPECTWWMHMMHAHDASTWCIHIIHPHHTPHQADIFKSQLNSDYQLRNEQSIEKGANDFRESLFARRTPSDIWVRESSKRLWMFSIMTSTSNSETSKLRSTCAKGFTSGACTCNTISRHDNAQESGARHFSHDTARRETMLKSQHKTMLKSQHMTMLKSQLAAQFTNWIEMHLIPENV